jgi:hypothetical protein
MSYTANEQKAYDFLLESGVSLKEIIDVVIQSNGLIGVGLVSFQEDINSHIENHYRSKFSKEALLNM